MIVEVDYVGRETARIEIGRDETIAELIRKASEQMDIPVPEDSYDPIEIRGLCLTRKQEVGGG